MHHLGWPGPRERIESPMRANGPTPMDTESTDLTRLESHFAFGKNWTRYARSVSEEQIAEAVSALRRLLRRDSLAGERVLDLGSGSGIHSLAALRLGAEEVLAVDIDPESVQTTRSMLERHAPHRRWRVAHASVFDLTPESVGRFDIVYSWGVLHHTGDMRRALSRAAALVAEQGQLVLSLYARTLLCPLWRLEKRWYSRASPRAQTRARAVYVWLYRVRSSIRARGFDEHVANYANRRRGMDFYHDVHDWMGGYPYESISVAALDRELRRLGFDRLLVQSASQGIFARIGIFGSCCTEFVYARLAPD